MGKFRWVSGRALPAQFDLQLRDWTLIEAEDRFDGCVILIDAPGLETLDWMRLIANHPREARRFMLVCGVDKAEDRSSLLQFGFGDAVTSEVALIELEARGGRLALVAREAFVDGKPIGLGPREFAPLGRMADQPGEPVSKEALFDDIWQLEHIPETNSIAVHMSRLRGKLTASGLPGVVETAGRGYRLCAAPVDGPMPTLRLPRRSLGERILSQQVDGEARHH